jgi:hypothetical protein
MSKKDFKAVADNISKGLGLLVDTPTPPAIKKSTEEGLSPGETRATFIIKKELLEKIKDIAYWERVLIKDIINLAMEETIKNYEKVNGTIASRPGNTEEHTQTIVRKRLHSKKQEL